jgi:hypothetical protein
MEVYISSFYLRVITKQVLSSVVVTDPASYRECELLAGKQTQENPMLRQVQDSNAVWLITNNYRLTTINSFQCLIIIN